MYLLKCDCGCVFTVKDILPNSSTCFTCQNCGKYFNLFKHIECDRLKQELDSIGMKIQVIPDDAKITVSFET